MKMTMVNPDLKGLSISVERSCFHTLVSQINDSPREKSHQLQILKIDLLVDSIAVSFLFY